MCPVDQFQSGLAERTNVVRTDNPSGSGRVGFEHDLFGSQACVLLTDSPCDGIFGFEPVGRAQTLGHLTGRRVCVQLGHMALGNHLSIGEHHHPVGMSQSLRG